MREVTKKLLALIIIFCLNFTPLAQILNISVGPQPVFAANNSCVASSSGGGYGLASRVGGVSLDQAAIFLADMSDITGAYYDSDQDRIVFVGQKNTSLPKFDKDDLAVAIKSLVFNNYIPAVSMEFKDPNNIWGDPNMKVLYYGGIEDTGFGQTLVDADYKLKQYAQGYNESGQKLTSSVSGYKSHWDRFLEKNPDPNTSSHSRWWISPQFVSLKEDDSSNSFIFDQVKMKVETEGLWSTNDPKWNQAAQEFSQQQTDYYDQFALETSSYLQAKQLAKIVGVVKWIKDNAIVNNFEWARDYQPKFVATPREIARLTTPPTQIGNTIWRMTGGVTYDTSNTYTGAAGTASSLKNASEAVATPTEETHWTFTKDGQQYESVAVAASAFRSFGSYTTAATDFSFPTVGSELTLAFQRVYSSFSGGQKGIGRGWDIIPARLVDNKTGWTTSCASRSIWKLGFSTLEGANETFTYTSCTTGYSADKPEYHSQVFDNGDGTYTVRRPDQVEYVFGPGLKLTKIKGKNGNILSYTYDSAGKLVSISDSQNHTLAISYNSSGLIAAVTDWANRIVRYAYDPQGNLTTVTDPRENAVTYTYNVNNKLASIKNRLGETIIENTYTPEAKLATQKDAAGTNTAYSYDEGNKQIVVVENQARTSRVTYDDRARILQDTDPLNKSTVYTYGTEYAPLTITDKNNNKTTYTYDVSGNMTSITFPNTKKVSYTYDAKNRLTKISDERYGLSPKLTSYTYDSTGNLIQSNEANILTNYTYNQFGDTLSVKNHLNQATVFTRDDFGNVLATTDPANQVTLNEYDVLGRLKKITDPEGKVATLAYDANSNVVSETDAVGTTAYVYDKENRLQQVLLPSNAATLYSYNSTNTLVFVRDALNYTTAYGYDSYRNLASQTDALDRTTTYAYDELNRQKQTTTPLGKVAKWEYDANGNVIKRIDAANQTTAYVYDNLNRLKTITYADAKNVSFTYDDRGNVTQMVDPVGTTKYEYDVFDRLTKVTNPSSKVLSYTYDSIGNLIKITYPDSRVVQYAYDANNRLKTVTDWNNQQTNYAYAKNGLLSSKQLPNGVTSSYGYDAANRLVSLEHVLGASQLAKYTYTRDSVGNITFVAEEGSVPGPTPTPTPTPIPTPTPTPTSTPIPSPTPTPTPTPTPIPTPTPSPTPAPSPSPNLKPDLVVSGITLSKTSITTSDYFDVTASITNQSTTGTGDIWLRVGLYYDRETSPTTSTSYDDTESLTDGVGAGQTLTVKENLVRFNTAGEHKIWILADRNNDVAESDETNNVYGPYIVTVTSSAKAPSLWARAKNAVAHWLSPDVALAQSVPVQQVTSFTYDALRQLKGVLYPDNSAQDYAYDAMGNRLSINNGGQVTGYSVDQDDRLTTAGSTNYTYDAKGNLVGIDGGNGASLSYDAENRLLGYSSLVPSNELAYSLTAATYSSIDVSYNGDPGFVDIDADGDQDLFLGESSGSIKFYRNNGTPTSASYALDASLVGSVDVGSRSTPTLVDIDNDADQDLFIGRSSGEISFYRNTGGTSSPTFALETNLFAAIDAGSYSAPTFVDIDNDGDKDLLVGESSGGIKYYKNTGSVTVPAFTADTSLFAGLDVGSYSQPGVVDFDKDGDWDLFIGNSSGGLGFYRNTGSNTIPMFSLVSANFSSIDVGSYAAPVFADSDGDGDQDLFVGEYYGVIKHYTAGPMPGPTTTFKYDGVGNRLEKTTGTSTTKYINDISVGLTRVLAETNVANTIQNYYTYGLDLISQGQSSSTGRVYPLSDGVGNVRIVTNSSGAVVGSYDYDAFGNLRGGTGTAATNYRFSGEQLDPESSFYFLRARYYDPALGRFISRDPIAGKLTNPQTQNPYAYGLNNPNSYADPSGESILDNQLQGANFEQVVTGAYNCVKNTAPVIVNGVKRIPDILTETNVGEIKSGAYTYLSAQMRDFISYAQQTGRTFTLYIQQGAAASAPLLEVVGAIGGQVIQVGGQVGTTIIDFVPIVVPIKVLDNLDPRLRNNEIY